MRKRLVKVRVLVAAALLSASSSALAEDEYRYRLTLVNRTGEHVSLVCNDGGPRPLVAGSRQTMTFVGPDSLAVNCVGYDHHGEAIATAQVVLDHHHLVHTMNLVRNGHH